MKKSILTAAIVLGSLSTFAQTATTEPATPSKTEQTTQAVEEMFTEIKIEEVPDAVRNALKKAYPTAILEKAYINEKKEYKLEIKVGEKHGALFADETGNWIEK